MGIYAHPYNSAAGIFGTDKKGVPEMEKHRRIQRILIGSIHVYCVYLGSGIKQALRPPCASPRPVYYGGWQNGYYLLQIYCHLRSSYDQAVYDTARTADDVNLLISRYLPTYNLDNIV
jgi:hypothetical protein